VANNEKRPAKPLVLTHPSDKPPRVPKVDIDRVLQAHANGVSKSTGLVVYHCTTDRHQARLLILKFGVDKTIELAAAFPTLDNGWLHNQGYPLRMLDRYINAVEIQLQGLGRRKKRDPTRICTDPDDPAWDEEL